MPMQLFKSLNIVIKKQVVVFFTLVLLLSSIFYWLIIDAGSINANAGLYTKILMWMPAIAAFIALFIYRHSFLELGWQLGKFRYLAIGYFLPVTYGFVAYSFIWILDLGSFNSSVANSGNLLNFIMLGASLGFFQSLLTSLGEEIGWRGFLVSRLAKFNNFTKTALLSGIIWFIWHAPLILMADYGSGAPKWFALTCFGILVMGLSFPFAWLRLSSKSLWPAVIMHASHNLFIGNVFEKLTINNGNTDYFSGEFGIALALVAIFTAVVFYKIPIEK